MLGFCAKILLQKLLNKEIVFKIYRSEIDTSFQGPYLINILFAIQRFFVKINAEVVTKFLWNRQP